MISKGGVENIFDQGSSTRASVLKGGKQVVLGGGVSTDATVSGTQTVSTGGTTVSAQVRVGGLQDVHGDADNSVVFKGGKQVVSSGGAGNFTVVSSGGTQSVLAGGLSDSATISSGAIQYVYGRTTATLVTSFADEIVYAGVDSGGDISGGVAWISGGSVVSAEVQAGGGQTLYPGATATGMIIGDLGAQELGNGQGLPGGTDSGTVVSNGGVEDVFDGGVASNTQVHSGGTMLVASGGLSVSAVMASGAGQTLHGVTGELDAVASGAVLKGGDQYVESGGFAYDTIISAGAVLDVYSGGVIGADGPTFSGGGTLRIENANDYTSGNESTPVGGFTGSAQIDLANVSFSAGPTLQWTQQNSRLGYLVVTDGTNTGVVSLLGQ